MPERVYIRNGSATCENCPFFDHDFSLMESSSYGVCTNESFYSNSVYKTDVCRKHPRYYRIMLRATDEEVEARNRALEKLRKKIRSLG